MTDPGVSAVQPKPDEAKIEKLRESMPVHYFDCDRFEVYAHGAQQGKCDCSANEDVSSLLAALGEARTEAAEWEESSVNWQELYRREADEAARLRRAIADPSTTSAASEREAIRQELIVQGFEAAAELSATREALREARAHVLHSADDAAAILDRALSGGSPKGEQRDDRAHGRDCAGPDCGDSENGYCGCWCHMNPALVAPAGSGGSLKPPKDGNE